MRREIPLSSIRHSERNEFPFAGAREEYCPIADQELKRISVYVLAIESWSGKRNWHEQAEQSDEWPPLVAIWENAEKPLCTAENAGSTEEFPGNLSVLGGLCGERSTSSAVSLAGQPNTLFCTSVRRSAMMPIISSHFFWNARNDWNGSVSGIAR